VLALRLTRGAHWAVHLRRLLVATASAGTGFLLLCTLGYAMSHPDDPGASVVRLAWCLTPLAATVHLALAVARTDPATRPRPGLAAIGLGPGRLMTISATTTALSCTLGSLLALLTFLQLRGDLMGMPVDGTAAQFLAADQPLPLPASLTLLGTIPALASATVALALRPRSTTTPTTRGTPHSYGRFGAYRRSIALETFGSYGRFGARLRGGERPPGRLGDRATQSTGGTKANGTASAPGAAQASGSASAWASAPAAASESVSTSAPTSASAWGPGSAPMTASAPAAASSASASAPVPASATAPAVAASAAHPTAPAPDIALVDLDPDPTRPPAPREAPAGLPWGTAVLAAGLAVETYAGSSAGDTGPGSPGGLPSGAPAVLVGWALIATGLALAGPGLTHLCGRLLQAARPGALRLLAGRVLMEEATRIGRPLGVVSAVVSGAYAMTALYDGGAPSFGPLSTFGTLLVTGCTLATLLTAAVEARQARADTTAALLRLGAPSTMLRGAAALRAGALLALFGPLTLIVAELAALALAR
jgi:hypothetical protein